MSDVEKPDVEKKAVKSPKKSDSAVSSNNSVVTYCPCADYMEDRLFVQCELFASIGIKGPI